MASKAQAITFALNLCSSYNEKTGVKRIDIKRAKKVFDFIITNVDLPDVPKTTHENIMDYIAPMLISLKGAQDRAAPETKD